jgi:hypothetical protein
MRKYLLPAVVCAALGALVLLLVERGETARETHPTPSPTPTVELTRPKSPLGDPAVTPTRLDENKWLRELQRSLAGDLAHAMDYRQHVCEEMDTILASEKLSRDLIDTIRKYGIESDDAARRDVVIPILRIVDHPEATRMIAEEYYRAKDEAEQMTLLEAMSKPFHDPKQAAVWGLDKALNSPSAEHREQAFDILRSYVADNELLVSTSIQVYSGSLDERQRQVALRTVLDRCDASASARDFARRVMRNPSTVEDILTVMSTIVNWGNDDDAARLEQLADRFPAMAEPLRDMARNVRRIRAEEAHPESPRHEDMEQRRKEDLERAALTEKQRKEREGE